MCGRTALSLNKEQVCCACSYKPKHGEFYLKPEWIDEHNGGKEYAPSYNIAPTDVTPVLIAAENINKEASNKRLLKPMMWGIIPPWHQGDYKSHNLSTNNCRLENITTSKLYGPILRNGGRCVVVVEGFYEWKTTDKSAKVKQPYYIYMPQDEETMIDDPATWNNHYSDMVGWKGVNLMYMAGLYQTWQSENIVIYAYSVITMESDSSFNWLHHRIPAILHTEEQISTWLDIENVGADLAISFLKPAVILSWHPVTTLVNNSRNKSPECNKRKIEKQNKVLQKTITNWFTKTDKKRQSSESTDQVSTSNKKRKVL